MTDCLAAGLVMFESLSLCYIHLNYEFCRKRPPVPEESPKRSKRERAEQSKSEDETSSSSKSKTKEEQEEGPPQKRVREEQQKEIQQEVSDLNESAVSEAKEVSDTIETHETLESLEEPAEKVIPPTKEDTEANPSLDERVSSQEHCVTIPF